MTVLMSHDVDSILACGFGEIVIINSFHRPTFLFRAEERQKNDVDIHAGHEDGDLRIYHYQRASSERTKNDGNNLPLCRMNTS